MVYLPLAEHSTRPVILREPTEVPSQPWEPFMHSRLCSLRLFDILYHTVFAHHSLPAACNSSSSLSIHQVLVSTLALLLARVGGALAICLCPHPSSNPSSLQFEKVNDIVGGRSGVQKVRLVGWLVKRRVRMVKLNDARIAYGSSELRSSCFRQLDDIKGKRWHRPCDVCICGQSCAWTQICMTPWYEYERKDC